MSFSGCGIKLSLRICRVPMEDELEEFHVAEGPHYPQAKQETVVHVDEHREMEASPGLFSASPPLSQAQS